MSLLEKRSQVRIPLRVRVVLQVGDRHVEGFSRDVSVGGMFIETAEPFPAGTLVSALVELPMLELPARIECVVRWSSPEGMGVAFESLRPTERWAIQQLHGMIVTPAR